MGLALGRCFGEFGVWHGQALLVAGFAQDALAGGVKSVLADRLHQALEFGEAEGLILSTPAQTKSNREIAHVVADHQLAMADQGVKIAAIVMLHNAYERFLWRLVRFGLVGNREQALKWIGKRSIVVEALIRDGVDVSVDAHLEKWWEELERDTMVAKWDRLTGLVGFPAKLSNPPWHFETSGERVHPNWRNRRWITPIFLPKFGETTRPGRRPSFGPRSARKCPAPRPPGGWSSR